MNKARVFEVALKTMREERDAAESRAAEHTKLLLVAMSRIHPLEARVAELEAQLVAARDNALEAVAKVAERFKETMFDSAGDDGALFLANKFRALKSQAAPRTFTLEEVERAYLASWTDSSINNLRWSDFCAALTRGGE